MKKTTFIIYALLLIGLNSHVCFADYSDIEDNQKPIARFWVGFNFADDSSSLNSSMAETYALPEAAGRQGTKQAAEFYSLDSSASFGLFYKANYVPHRLHFEADVNSDEDWYGDFRYSYKDNVLVRVLPRRFYHNLDNITVLDYDGGNSNDITDATVDDYGLRVDIDQYRLRLKTPDFPLHAYLDGEIVNRQGKQQLVFNPSSTTSKPRDIHQTNEENTFGTNAHLGPVEIEISHAIREFEDKAAPPIGLMVSSRSAAANGIPYGDSYYHNLIPTLRAETNTLKIHTSHTGRIVASATLSDINKSNLSSGASATNTMGYGEVSWLTRENLSFAAKYRHQRNRASHPGPGVSYTSDGTALSPIAGGGADLTKPGFQADYEMASLIARYVPMPKLNLKAEYTKDIKDVSYQSSDDWVRPLKTIKDTYQLGANWRALNNVKVNGKVSYRDIRTEFGSDDSNFDPEQTTRGVIGVSWILSPRVSTFLSADLTKEKTGDNHYHGDRTDIFDDPADYTLYDLNDVATSNRPDDGDKLAQTYLASVSFMVNEKLSVSPSYTYMSAKQEKEIVWDYGNDLMIDTEYFNKQVTHNLAVTVMYNPTEVLALNATIDYTTTEGTYNPSSNITGTPAGWSSGTDTEELNLNLDGDYDLGGGWGLGLELRYTDWRDTSFDNPSDGEYIGGMLKVTKVLNL